MEKIRINKYLSSVGYCSRRKADELILAGMICINGEKALAGCKVCDEDEIIIDGKTLVSKLAQAKEIWIALNKPRGIVCSENGQGSQTIYEFMGFKEHMFSVGRLDKDSEGLLLLTNQGQAAEKIAKGRNKHEKEYEVSIDQPVTEEFLHRMMSGVEILGTVTRRCRAWKTSKYSFNIIISQGLNRQIRRMTEECGANVTRLKRIRICNIMLGDLKTGESRRLTKEEISDINSL